MALLMLSRAALGEIAVRDPNSPSCSPCDSPCASPKRGLLKRGCQPAQAWEALKRGKHASAERIDPADATTDAVDAAGKPASTKMARLQSTVSAAVARAMAMRD